MCIAMTRIVVNKKVGVHVLLDRSIDLWISETAIKTGKTRTNIITEAILEYLEKTNPEGRKNMEGQTKEEEARELGRALQEIRKDQPRESK